MVTILSPEDPHPVPRGVLLQELLMVRQVPLAFSILSAAEEEKFRAATTTGWVRIPVPRLRGRRSYISMPTHKTCVKPWFTPRNGPGGLPLLNSTL
jgi:hypothetical protein